MIKNIINKIKTAILKDVVTRKELYELQDRIEVLERVELMLFSKLNK